MRVVNLSRRPSVNRRPILRVAVLLWVVGAVSLAVNVRLYTGHWLGSAENRRLLAEVRQKLAGQQEVLAEQSQKFRRVKLDQRNRRAAFLNQLIDARTFPWSGLFDDLEEVLPEGVRLVSVQPSVRLASNRRSRAQAERVRTASATPAAAELAEDAMAQDEVDLRLNGVAQSFDQLEVFVKRLYGSPFGQPFLSNVTLDANQGPGATVFTLSTVYQTRREPLPEPPAGEPGLAEGGEAGPADGPLVSEARQAGSPPPGSPPPGLPPPGSPPTGSPQTGKAAQDPESRLAVPGASPAPGRTATGRTGAPAAGTPAAGTPSRGRAARPDIRPGTDTRPGFVALPDAPPPPVAADPETPPTRRPPTRRPPTRRPPRDRPPNDRPSNDRPSNDQPSNDRPPNDDGPSFGDRDASSTPAILQQPRQLGSIVPAEPWDRRPALGLVRGAVA